MGNFECKIAVFTQVLSEGLGKFWKKPIEVRAVAGPKYWKVDWSHNGQWGGKYMVEVATGSIFGIKAYGRVHRGHCFGTLDTLAEWNWAAPVAIKLQKTGLVSDPLPQFTWTLPSVRAALRCTGSYLDCVSVDGVLVHQADVDAMREACSILHALEQNLMRKPDFCSRSQRRRQG